MVRGAGGRCGAAGGLHRRGRGGRGSDHLGMGQFADGAPAVLVDGDGRASVATEKKGTCFLAIEYRFKAESMSSWKK
jgi:hypothetical protein